MTREEAIAYANRVIELGLNDETQAFCETAIKALEQDRYYKNLANSYEKTINKLTKAISEKEPILDKIRAEIAELRHYYPMGHDYQIAITRCIADIDKYKAESEEINGR